MFMHQFNHLNWQLGCSICYCLGFCSLVQVYSWYGWVDGFYLSSMGPFSRFSVWRGRASYWICRSWASVVVLEYGRVDCAVMGMVLVTASRILLVHVSIAVSISVLLSWNACWLLVGFVFWEYLFVFVPFGLLHWWSWSYWNLDWICRYFCNDWNVISGC